MTQALFLRLLSYLSHGSVEEQEAGSDDGGGGVRGEISGTLASPP